MTIQEYTNKYYNEAAAVSSKDLPPAFILGHSYLESGRGTSQLTKQANNFFGVKALPGQPSVTMKTREFRNGKYIVIPQNFRKYATAKDSFQAYSNLLKNKRYKRVMEAKTYLDKAKLLKTTGYYGAEDSAIINLAKVAKQFDSAIKNRPNSTLILPGIALLILAGALVYSNK
jgi:flagellum-specific peptidoglycan hydrolase FlgJ